MSEEDPICCIGELEPDERLNVLFFGSSGVGKSCLVNALCTNESIERKVKKVAKTRSEYELDKQCTCSFNIYELRNPKIRIFDTVGWNEGTNYLHNEFENILNGRIPHGTKIDGMNPGVAINSRIIDVVVFCVDGMSHSLESTLKSMKKYVEKAVEMKRVVITVVTKVDRFFDEILSEDIEAAERKCRYNGKIKKVLKDVNMIFREPSMKIFPIISYETDDNVAHPLIQRLKIPILEAIRPVRKPKKSLPILSLSDGEIPIEFRSSSSSNIDFKKCKGEEYTSNESKASQDHVVVISESPLFYKSIKMGDRIFRLFLFRCMTYPTRMIIGIADSLTLDYFETTTEFDVIDTFKKSFSDNFVPEYIFLTKTGSPWIQMNESVEYIRIDLGVGGCKPFVLKKKRFDSLQCIVENQIQVSKQIKLMSSKSYEDEVNSLKSENKEKLDSMAVEMNELRKLMKLQQDERKREMDDISKKHEEEMNSQREFFVDEIRTKNADLDKLDKEFTFLREKLDRFEIEQKKMIEDLLEQNDRKRKDDEARRRIEEERRRIAEEEERFKDFTKTLSKEQFEQLQKQCGLDYTWKRVHRVGNVGTSYDKTESDRVLKEVTNSLLIIKSSNDSVFGVYTTQSWSSSAGWIHDASSWMFGFESKKTIKVFLPISGTKNIHTSGSGFHVGNSSCQDLCFCSYHTILGTGFNKGSVGAHFLNGGEKNFSIVALEVFQKP